MGEARERTLAGLVIGALALALLAYGMFHLVDHATSCKGECPGDTGQGAFPFLGAGLVLAVAARFVTERWRRFTMMSWAFGAAGLGALVGALFGDGDASHIGWYLGPPLVVAGLAIPLRNHLHGRAGRDGVSIG